jgi:hypothetical protein
MLLLVANPCSFRGVRGKVWNVVHGSASRKEKEMKKQDKKKVMAEINVKKICGVDSFTCVRYMGGVFQGRRKRGKKKMLGSTVF